MELSQLIQKSVFKILSIQTPLKFLWILGIFEQNQLSKKKTLQNGSSWRKILVCNSASCGEATLHARIFDLEHFCGRDFFFWQNFEFFQDFRLSKLWNFSLSLLMIFLVAYSVFSMKYSDGMPEKLFWGTYDAYPRTGIIFFVKKWPKSLKMDQNSHPINTDIFGGTDNQSCPVPKLLMFSCRLPYI